MNEVKTTFPPGKTNITDSPPVFFFRGGASHIIYMKEAAARVREKTATSFLGPALLLSSAGGPRLLLLHVLHVSKMGNMPFARVQSYLPETATHIRFLGLQASGFRLSFTRSP